MADRTSKSGVVRLRSRAEQYAAGKALRETCPRDAHAGWRAPKDRRDAVDTVLAAVAGDPDSKVGTAKNGVYLKNGLRANELYQAIKAGCTFATNGPSLALDVNGELMGDTAYIFDGPANINLTVNSECSTCVVVKIDIIKNGAIMQTINPMTPSYEVSLEDTDVTGDGYYRVEVTSVNGLTGKYQFAWSNPLFVDC